jgi:hypothetical protein
MPCDGEDRDEAAEHDELVEPIGEHADDDVQHDCRDVAGADDHAGRAGVETSGRST